MASKLQLQDWPYLKKYEKKNANLPILESGQKKNRVYGPFHNRVLV